MRKYLTTHIYIALTLLTFILAIILGAVVADMRQNAVVRSIETLLRTQENTMHSLADITDRNGVDETIKGILKDCSERGAFESLLGSLGTLTKKDLLIAQSLFEGCGNFESEQKALMVGRLEREFLVYKDLRALLSTFKTKNLSLYNESAWDEIVQHEILRSSLLNDLTIIQAEIISELVKGGSSESTSVRALVAEAQNIRQLLSVYDQKVDAVRNSIVLTN